MGLRLITAAWAAIFAAGAASDITHYATLHQRMTAHDAVVDGLMILIAVVAIFVNTIWVVATDVSIS